MSIMDTHPTWTLKQVRSAIDEARKDERQRCIAEACDECRDGVDPLYRDTTQDEQYTWFHEITPGKHHGKTVICNANNTHERLYQEGLKDG